MKYVRISGPPSPSLGEISVKIPLLVLTLLLLMLVFSASLYAQGKVGINTQKPTATLDINGNIRIREDAANGKILTSDSLGNGRWTYPISKKEINVIDFGAIPNDNIDDTEAFLAAIDSASKLGGEIKVARGTFIISKTLVLPDGVFFEGEGRGNDPLQTPTTGSILLYDGEGWVAKLVGHHSGIRNLTISEMRVGGGSSGVQVLADARLVEGVFCEQLHIFGFASGTSFELTAINQGGIAYGSFQRIRMRHATVGLSIVEEEGSFVNSNTFQKIVISGGGFDHGMLIKGGNNNVFIGSIIEPYESQTSHLAVQEGQISAYDLRIEGRDQGNVKPLIQLGKLTYNNVIEGIFSGGFIEDHGANQVRMISSRNMQLNPTGANCFMNAGFHGLKDNFVPEWTMSGSGIAIEVAEEEIIPGHKVLKITVPAGSIGVFSPNFVAMPKTHDFHFSDFCKVGVHGKTNVEGAIQVIFNDAYGEKQSLGHTGSDNWEVIGLAAHSPQSSPPFPRFRFINSQGQAELVCYITTPSFTFGPSLPEIYAKPITEAGGRTFGTLSTGMFEVNLPSNNRLVLPHSGNVFVLSGTHDIHRINDENKDRFPRGCTITLLFNHAGVKLQQLGFIRLMSDYISTPNSSITLLSLGNGVWRELNRNL